MSGFEFIIRLKDYVSSGANKIAQSVGVARNQLNGMAVGVRNVEKNSTRLDGTLGKLKGTLAAAFTIAAVLGFANKVTDARAEFEKFQAVMANTFQSKEIGDGAMAMLTKFAAETPYQLNELTGGFIKLVNRGINPTQAEMIKMGDLASSQGKGFDQLVEAIMDAQTGEFERMKEFGIKASKSGDQVSLSFKGVTKTVQNNEQAIKDAILQYGAMKGVAGSMDVVSKTLGGSLSNLGDKWWGFLVAVGGESGTIFNGVIDSLSNGLDFLSQNLASISKWFNILWSYIQPVITAFSNFIKTAFGIKDAGDVLGAFGTIMQGVLIFVDWFTTGLTTLINFLGPFAQGIAIAAIEWGILNALIAVTPIGWVIIGIMALVTIIGMVVKYTNGWGKSWEALKTMFTVTWEQIKADFKFGVDFVSNRFKMIYLVAKDVAQQIIGTFSKVGEAIKLALNGDFSGAFKKIGEKVKTSASNEIEALRKKNANDEKTYTVGNADRVKKFTKAKSEFGITVDTAGISKDWNKLKKQFSGDDKKPADSSLYDDYAANANKTGAKTGAGAKGANGKSVDGIIGGGSKITHITVNLAKMQDQIVINTVNTGEGATKLRQILEEELNRLLGSISQMQTA